jgi:peptidoglycan-associated lipoprotein
MAVVNVLRLLDLIYIKLLEEREMKIINYALVLCSLLVMTACSAKKDGGENNALMSELENKVGNKVYFAFDSSAISSDAGHALTRQAEFIKAHEAKNFTVAGYCDERGTVEYNIALGERRANSVLKFLAHHGVAPDKITVVSFGKEYPAVEGDNEAAWSKNRRAVTTIN